MLIKFTRNKILKNFKNAKMLFKPINKNKSTSIIFPGQVNNLLLKIGISICWDVE